MGRTRTTWAYFQDGPAAGQRAPVTPDSERTVVFTQHIRADLVLDHEYALGTRLVAPPNADTPNAAKSFVATFVRTRQPRAIVAEVAERPKGWPYGIS